MIAGLLRFALTICFVCVSLGTPVMCNSSDTCMCVGPCSSEPMLGAFKWSPDGTQLAYFSGRMLMFSDTLANSTAVMELPLFPHRFEWIDNSSICLHLFSSPAEDSTLNQLVLLDIAFKTITALDEYWRYKTFGFRDNTLHDFDGPRVTLEENCYYTHTEYDSDQSPDGILRERRLVRPNERETPANNHILCWGDDGLYRANLTRTDSVRLAPKPYRHIPLTPVLNSDGTLALLGETLMRLEDSTAYNYFHQTGYVSDSGVHCGLAYVSFNPRFEEILFQLTCDNGDRTIADSIGVYDYRTSELTIFTPPDGNTQCRTPVYAPDGRKIAFWSDGSLYIMYRKPDSGNSDVLCTRAGGYEIVDIVNLSKMSSGPMSCPLKWSPDGSKLAGIRGGSFVVVDTMGNDKTICELTMPARRWEWLSDYEILVFHKASNRDSIYIKMTRYDIKEGTHEDIQERLLRKPFPFGLVDGYFEGPHLSIQGNAYYFLYQDGIKVPVLPESKYNKKRHYEDNYLYRVHADGLFLIRFDLKDSLYAFSKSYIDTISSYKMAYRFNRSQITRLSDSAVITIDTLPFFLEMKEGTVGCGALYQAINPSLPEALFELSCDSGMYVVSQNFFLLDLSNMKSTKVSDLIGRKQCDHALYDPFGKNIAARSGSDLFLIKRKKSSVASE